MSICSKYQGLNCRNVDVHCRIGLHVYVLNSDSIVLVKKSDEKKGKPETTHETTTSASGAGHDGKSKKK